ncbi:DUF262 domain-containing protein [Cryobacterium melibiosiphilum]|uniref:DUF262 domain-containing protein n=2 Tax=Cryobacterium melibiosiphilum TaxID=995039 RepID=A0A3A5MER8_9MICO|nr:DUF262 domain-containing protein [Cryobacterium melibiosiphilum]
MAGSTFKTNPVSLQKLLEEAESGKLQLPDFQRSWVWDEERIRSLIASVSRGFPVGAIMTLSAGSDVAFKPRPVEGAPAAALAVIPDALLLDGQQRLTSLYQVTLRNAVVSTITAKKKRVKRWFYIDMRKALDASEEREAAIVSVPEDKVIRSDFGRTVELDLSTRDAEIENLMYPVSMLFAWAKWQGSYISKYAGADDFAERYSFISRFDDEVVGEFTGYQIPVIELDKSTSKEAVCVVFEKVNTGGKPLDAFELITAMYAADGYELRRDWYGGAGAIGLHKQFTEYLRLPNAPEGILANVDSTDVLHVISLFHTRDRRVAAEAAGKVGRDLPQIIGNRAALLNLPLAAYVEHLPHAIRGFELAAKFLMTLRIYRPYDLPYQTQIIPLAAILGEHPDIMDHMADRERLTRWYWNGVFGELYGSTTESRIARDFIDVPLWMRGGAAPSTLDDATFRADRLWTMRMRLSAAYKGVNALLMGEGTRDFRSGQEYANAVFFDEGVDIHHIFPQKWCQTAGIDRAVYDSIVNKTPLSARTNRIIGGVAPSDYLAKLERGSNDSPPVPVSDLDASLNSHLIDVDRIRCDDFDGFMSARHERLISLIEGATGQRVYREHVDADELLEEEFDEAGDEAEHTLSPVS